MNLKSVHIVLFILRKPRCVWIFKGLKRKINNFSPNTCPKIFLAFMCSMKLCSLSRMACVQEKNRDNQQSKSPSPVWEYHLWVYQRTKQKYCTSVFLITLFSQRKCYGAKYWKVILITKKQWKMYMKNLHINWHCSL